MPSEMMRQVLQMIDAEVQVRTSGVDYELAYQARVAIDRIRFAIRQTEEFAPRTDQMREVSLQLLDALDGIQSAERRFQERFRIRAANTQRAESAELTTAGSSSDGGAATYKTNGHTSAAQT
jgi:hypothetical protein